MFYIDSDIVISNYFVLWCLSNHEVNAGIAALGLFPSVLYVEKEIV